MTQEDNLQSEPSHGPEHLESIKIAHLTMLQGVITRMGANSFTLKALAATFGSAAIAALASSSEPSVFYAVAALIPIFMFWLMDAQYLRIERAYRKLYDKVRTGEQVEPYSLDATAFMSHFGVALRIAISWSVAIFYLAILISLAVVASIIFCGA
ncbi:hypothetical protein [Celeribacter halophilus]|uniref:hypothetical protein n=1 Tax=Celeribacter halophilus TaxID=576117 RepID=UPI003A90DE0B